MNKNLYIIDKENAISNSKVDINDIKTLESVGFKFIGLKDNESVGFYYDPEIERYVLGFRTGTLYFCDVAKTGLSAYKSKYLHYENKDLQPYEVNAINWVCGIIKQLNK